MEKWKKKSGKGRYKKQTKKEIVELKHRGWENQMIRERQEKKKQR